VSWIRTALGELFGLFVDDVPYTVAILAWLAAGTLALPLLPEDPLWRGPLLAAGCAAILVVSARRAALRHRKALAARAADRSA